MAAELRAVRGSRIKRTLELLALKDRLLLSRVPACPTFSKTERTRYVHFKPNNLESRSHPSRSHAHSRSFGRASVLASLPSAFIFRNQKQKFPRENPEHRNINCLWPERTRNIPERTRNMPESNRNPPEQTRNNPEYPKPDPE